MTGETMGSRGERPRRLRERYDDRGKRLEQGDDPARGEATSAASTSEATKRDTRVVVGDYDDQRSKMMTTRRAR